MALYIYAKMTEKMEVFDEVLRIPDCIKNEIFVYTEHKRCFRVLEHIKTLCYKDDAVMISGLSSLGTNEKEISRQLEWFIKNEISLAVCSFPSTYRYGISQPVNPAVLETICIMLDAKEDILSIQQDRRKHAGRKHMEFPDNWEELYEKWEQKKISSVEFMKESGMKKATFYNLITEYKEILKLNKEYIEKYQNIV